MPSTYCQAALTCPWPNGNLGERIAARVFDIELETSASRAAIDGRFRTGALRGKSVNIKWYLKREGLLDMTTAGSLDYYLVMTGPAGSAAHSHASTRPWRIDGVYLFDAAQLCAYQRARGVQAGTAASVARRWWDAAEIYPRASNPLLYVSEQQAAMLELFQPGSSRGSWRVGPPLTSGVYRGVCVTWPGLPGAGHQGPG